MAQRSFQYLRISNRCGYAWAVLRCRDARAGRGSQGIAGGGDRGGAGTQANWRAELSRHSHRYSRICTLHHGNRAGRPIGGRNQGPLDFGSTLWCGESGAAIGFEARGARVQEIATYRWALPQNTQPLVDLLGRWPAAGSMRWSLPMRCRCTISTPLRRSPELLRIWQLN